MSELFDVARSVLSDTLLYFPYNSAVQFHEFVARESQDERWGASCPWQAFHAGGRISALTGATPHYLLDGRHVAAVFLDEEYVTVIDPYLLHTEPFRLSRHDPDSARSVVDAYPIRERRDGATAPARTRATWFEAESTVRIEYLKYSPSRGHNVLSRAFNLRLDSALGEVPPPHEAILPLLTHPEQNNLSIRTVHPADLRMRELVLPLSDGGAAKVDRLVARDNQGAVHRHGTAGFDRELAGIADATGHTADEAIALLLDAAVLYHRIAPSGQVLPDYSLADD